MKALHKSLLLPRNSEGKLFIQDRRGHKEPDWGFFGGTVEEGETPLEAVVRESEEELCITLQESDLEYLGAHEVAWNGTDIIRHFYLYRTDQVAFDVREGAGGSWLSLEEARLCLDQKDKLEAVIALLERAGNGARC